MIKKEMIKKEMKTTARMGRGEYVGHTQREREREEREKGRKGKEKKEKKASTYTPRSLTPDGPSPAENIGNVSSCCCSWSFYVFGCG